MISYESCLGEGQRSWSERKQSKRREKAAIKV